MNTLEYNVLLPNINNEIYYKFNIFHSNRFLSCLMDLKARCRKEINIDLHEEIRRCIAYSFRAKAEYEIVVKCLFGKVEHKIDIYEQVTLNFDLFYDYLLQNWNKIPAKTYRQQENMRKKENKL